MQITWHGQYTIKITTKDSTIILDPSSPDSGLPAFRSKADVVALSNPTNSSMSYLKGIQGDYLLIDTPGEYSFHGITLHALGWFNGSDAEKSLQRWNIEGVTLLHVGAIQRELTTEELQELQQTGIDILIVPVGGGSGLSTKQALDLVSTIEPRIVIPIHFEIPRMKEKLEPVTSFAKEMGVGSIEPQKKLVVRAKGLPQEDVETVILSA